MRGRWRSMGIPLLLTAVSTLLIWLISGTPCLLHGVLGLPCPGCGLTRATVWMLQGEFARAWHTHPLHPLALLLLLALPLLMWLRPAWLSTLAFRRVAGVIIALFLSLYAVRMICCFPTTAPMVYNTHSLLGRVLTWVGLLT